MYQEISIFLVSILCSRNSDRHRDHILELPQSNKGVPEFSAPAALHEITTRSLVSAFNTEATQTSQSRKILPQTLSTLVHFRVGEALPSSSPPFTPPALPLKPLAQLLLRHSINPLTHSNLLMTLLLLPPFLQLRTRRIGKRTEGLRSHARPAWTSALYQLNGRKCGLRHSWQSCSCGCASAD